MVSASFLTEAAALDRHTPPQLRLVGEPVVTVEFHFLADVDWLAGRGYAMIQVLWPATFEGRRDRVVGRFLAVMWENLADPIITGRGEVGQPKLYAEIPPLETAGGSHACSASWMGYRFLELGVQEGGSEATLPAAVPATQGTLMLKYVPRTGRWGEPEICQVTFIPAATPDAVVEWSRPATGFVTFEAAEWSDLPTMHHVASALASLPVRERRAASVARIRGGKPYLDARVLL